MTNAIPYELVELESTLGENSGHRIQMAKQRGCVTACATGTSSGYLLGPVEDGSLEAAGPVEDDSLEAAGPVNKLSSEGRQGEDIPALSKRNYKSHRGRKCRGQRCCMLMCRGGYSRYLFVIGIFHRLGDRNDRGDGRRGCWCYTLPI
ncbi:Hypp311 [Branchiostoma lanceolatum]|uniref:Hypp311 protein n=1 Tax=Branchiostoma lanceolatum TaxID=7740 RepID=A0A8J9VL64_BRALA|nr:Hypp311 [Branchiostoma lanceolatum]